MFVSESERNIIGTAQEVFDACRSVEVQTMAGGVISAKVVGGRLSGLSELADRTTWSAHFCGIRVWITTQIVTFSESEQLEIQMMRGSFDSFRHTFDIIPDPSGSRRVLLKNKLTFAIPEQKLKRLFVKAFLLPAMVRSQQMRLDTIKKAVEEKYLENLAEVRMAS